jgi:leucyl aminopeptidase (aminopeptidase T)
MSSWEQGAETVVDQSLGIDPNETVLLLDDGNDRDLIDAIVNKLDNTLNGSERLDHTQIPKLSSHGQEPPKEVAEAMKKSDVFIAPTSKSITHTTARSKATSAGARGVTMGAINKEIWNTGLTADYEEVRRITEQAYSELKDEEEIKIQTPSGTDFSFKIDKESYIRDTGIYHDKGDFGNLPAGEIHGGVIDGEGKIVIDHFPYAPEGTTVYVEDSKVIGIEHPREEEDSRLSEALENVSGNENIAEFGFGTNPEAELVDHMLQDEKILGTIHIAYGDNTTYFDRNHERYNECDVHWDSLCMEPTVYFGDKLMLNNGEPVFIE